LSKESRELFFVDIPIDIILRILVPFLKNKEHEPAILEVSAPSAVRTRTALTRRQVFTYYNNHHFLEIDNYDKMIWLLARFPKKLLTPKRLNSFYFPEVSCPLILASQLDLNFY
jgi:hypothetical protein